MESDLLFESGKSPACEGAHWLQTSAGRHRLYLVRHPRARRYILRLRPDGCPRVTIPRGGSIAEALRFVSAHAGWLDKQLALRTSHPHMANPWREGAQVLLRGEPVVIKLLPAGTHWRSLLGPESITIRDAGQDLRPAIEKHLRWLASRELPMRANELASLHGLKIGRVNVRNQRSRWGSCSSKGTVSLNWRLIQAPLLVRDYIILHELAHLRHMNHSREFWREVARICPDYQQAEAWLKSAGRLLMR